METLFTECITMTSDIDWKALKMLGIDGGRRCLLTPFVDV